MARIPGTNGRATRRPNRSAVRWVVRWSVGRRLIIVVIVPLSPPLNSVNFLLEGTPFSDFLLETFYLILRGILTFGIVQILASKSSQKPISVNFSTAVSVPNDVIQRILSWMWFNEITVLHGVKFRESWRAYVLKGFQNPTRGISPRRYVEATGNPATRLIYPRRYTFRMRLFL